MNQPIKLYVTDERYRTGKPIGLALDHLRHLALAYGATVIAIGEPVTATASPVFRHLARTRMLHEILNRSVVDLTRDEAEIRAAVRRRYKSRIGHGENALKFSFYSGDLLTDATVEELIERVCEIRRTEPDQQHLIERHLSEMAACVDLCRKGFGEVEVARSRDGVVVGIIFTIDDGNSSYYAIGAYAQPDVHKQSHAMLYQAILRAKRRGRLRFFVSIFNPPAVSVGRLNGAGVVVSEPKIRNMAWFKSGFTDTVELMQVYKVFL